MSDLSGTDSVLFDLDGTLWDASSACAEAWTASLGLMGRSDLAVTAAQARSFTGLPIETIFSRFFPTVGRNLLPRLLEIYQQQEAELMRSQGGQLYPGTEDVLKVLHQSHRLFIVSNCFDGYIENFFRLTGLQSVFESYESLGRTGKPKAENIALVIRRHILGSPVYVGDTVHDAEAAKKNQIPFVFAAYGFGKVEAPNHSISNMGDLLKLL